MGNTIRISCCIILSFILNIPLSVEEEILNDATVLYRLPQTLIPTSYDLSLKINPKEIIYTGTVTITFDAVDEKSTINDIYIHVDREFVSLLSAVLNNDTDCVVGMANEANILDVSCSQGAIGSQNSLSIEFIAKFSPRNGYGLAKSTYIDQGKEQIFIVSNFKPTYARRAFPCLDEPAFIANFSIEITYPEEYVVLSNSLPLQDTDAGNNLKTTRFATTAQISTYLVSILISKLEAVYANSSEEYEFKVFTRPSFANLTDTVVDNYYSILDTINNYVGTHYQDLGDAECYHVAIPEYSDCVGDFGFFAYRETDLLDEGNETTSRTTQDILTTMAYKLAHEWYGGAVATNWWSDIWANEGIATYLKYVIVDKVNKEFDLLKQFTVEVSQKALHYDAYPFAQPLSSSEADVELTRDIVAKLDLLSHYKGASILHMIKGIFADEGKFQEAVSYHWDQRKEGVSNGSDLLLDLSTAYGQGVIYNGDLYSYLLTWIESPGYPLLTVQLTDSLGGGIEVFSLSQKRFVYPMDTTNYTDVRWMIPINVALAGNHFNVRVDTFLTTDQMDYYNLGYAWVLFNVQMGFYYRVNYDEPLWRKFIDILNNETTLNQIHVLSRAQLVDDIFNIARTGDVSYYTVFDLADYLALESEYYPWYAASNAFSYLIGKMGNPIAEENLKIYISDLLASVLVYPFIGDGTHIDRLTQVVALELGGRLNHPRVVNYSTKEFETYKTLGTLSDYNFRGVVLCNAIRYSENVEEDWQFLWDVYVTTMSVQEQHDVLKALGCAEDKDLLRTYLLKITAADSLIKRQDVMVVFTSVFSSSVGIAASMAFLEDTVTDFASLEINILSEMLYTLAEKLPADEELHWLTNILANDVFDAYPEVRSKATVLASVNNYWVHNYQAQVREIFLSPRTTTTTTTTPATGGSTENEGTTVSIQDTSEHEVTTQSTSTTTEGRGEKIHALKLVVIFITFLFFVIR